MATGRFTFYSIGLCLASLLVLGGVCSSAEAPGCRQPAIAVLSRRNKVVYVQKGKEDIAAKALGAKLVSPGSWRVPPATEEAPVKTNRTMAKMAATATVEVIRTDGPISAGIFASLKGDRVPGPNALIVVYENSSCSVVVPANNVACHKRGNFWVTVNSAQYTQCAEALTGTCVERFQATHTIAIWKDDKCTVLVRRIHDGEMRCQ